MWQVKAARNAARLLYKKAYNSPVYKFDNYSACPWMSYCDLITAVKLLSNMIAIRRFGTAGIQYRS